MNPAQTIATIVACAVVAVVGIVATLVKVLKPARPFNGETKEILLVLREIRDRLVASAYEQARTYDCLARVEQSQQALHTRYDKVVGVRE